MTIEQEISDLKCAFRNYIEIKKRDEVNKVMNKHINDFTGDSEYYVESRIDDKYKSVTEYLR